MPTVTKDFGFKVSSEGPCDLPGGDAVDEAKFMLYGGNRAIVLYSQV